MKKRHFILSLIIIIIAIILNLLRAPDFYSRVIGVIITLAAFTLADKSFKIGFKKQHYFIIILMSILGMLLSPIYLIFQPYDKILHFVNPFLTCFILFFFINKLKVSFGTKLLLTFTLLVTLITLAEVAEFVLDQFFDLKLQGVFTGKHQGLFGITTQNVTVSVNPNTDTMLDIILGMLGAGLFIIIKFLRKNKK